MSQEQFILDTLETNLFTIQDINRDNSCLFRSLSNYFNFAMPSKKLSELKRLDNWGMTKALKDIDLTTNYIDETRDRLARHILDRIVDYAEEHPDLALDETGISIRDYVSMVHNFTYSEYLNIYRTFPADKQYWMEDYDGYDRWGSHLEVLILSKIVDCAIVILNSQSWNIKKNRVETGKIVNSKPQRNVRFKIYQIVNSEKLNNKLPIFLVWKKSSRGAHYIVAYPNDIQRIMAILQNYI
jgi:hypothetical protein